MRKFVVNFLVACGGATTAQYCSTAVLYTNPLPSTMISALFIAASAATSALFGMGDGTAALRGSASFTEVITPLDTCLDTQNKHACLFSVQHNNNCGTNARAFPGDCRDTTRACADRICSHELHCANNHGTFECSGSSVNSGSNSGDPTKAPTSAVAAGEEHTVLLSSLFSPHLTSPQYE